METKYGVDDVGIFRDNGSKTYMYKHGSPNIDMLVKYISDDAVQKHKQDFKEYFRILKELVFESKGVS